MHSEQRGWSSSVREESRENRRTADDLECVDPTRGGGASVNGDFGFNEGVEGVGGGSGDPVLRGEVDGLTEGRFGFGPRVDGVVVGFDDADLCASGEACDGLLFVGVC